MMNFDAYDLTPGIPQFKNYDFYGSQDQPLTNSTPLGNYPTIDAENDKRTAFDFKRDYLQALKDTQDPNEEGYYISANGNKYETVDASRKGELGNGLYSYLSAFFATGGNQAKAYNVMMNSVDGLAEKGKRYAKIEEFESKGYNPMDIQNYINDGDPKSLIASKGKWKIEGDRQVNELTGEIRELTPTAKEAETIRHNKAMEGIQQQGSYSINNGYVMNNKSGTVEAIPGYETAGDKQRAAKAEELQAARQEQVSATATNAKQAEQFGTDIKGMSGLDYAGPGWKNNIERAWQSGANNDDPLAPVNAKVSQYNNNLTTLGNAALYTESGGKRIFAKEMENAGKKFIPIDTHSMNKQQIQSAVDNNAEIIRMYYDWEKRTAAGKSTVAMSTETAYPEGEANPTPAAPNQDYQPGDVVNFHGDRRRLNSDGSWTKL